MAEAVTPSRRIALEVVRSVRQGDLADRALSRAGADLDPRDFAWTQELVYGMLRLRGRLDHLLESLVRSGIGGLEPDVLDVLRLGAYQLREMGSVPPYAAISQSVELVRWAGAGRAAGLVNGVLHSLLRSGDGAPYPDPAVDPLGYLTRWGSHPVWLVERWLARWGFEDTRALVDADNQRPELYLRPVRDEPDVAVEKLAAAGLDAQSVPLSPESIRLSAPATARDALAVVDAVVQDPAGALVMRYAAIPEGARVIDLCAAPGGKAVSAAESARYVVASDLSRSRLRRLRENTVRLRLQERIGLVVADARYPPFRSTDAVVLDAPCTGTGTLRRHPDGRWRVTEADLAALVSLQRELLEAAASLVSDGGLLVYSTCSLEPEENEMQIGDFLERHPGFERAPEAGAVDGGLESPPGDLVVLPQRHGFDGSYAARLRRIR